MDEKIRNEVVHFHDEGHSNRWIARELHISRARVKRVLDKHYAQRESGTEEGPLPKVRRTSLLDEYEEFIQEQLAEFPNLTAVRLLEKLQEKGFQGQYTIVREKLRALRPSPQKRPENRFETGPGKQAQSDFSPYTVDFTEDGKKKVHAFIYVLSYSRRFYLRFVESEDFLTLIREHQKAFDHFNGVAAVCLYDNQKAVVTRWDGDDPVYNTRFLDFATFYKFSPWACMRRRPKTKGKGERPFDYIVKNFFNGRKFRNLDHMNQVAAWWTENVADVRNHGTTNERPIDRFEKEKDALRPLPEHPYRACEVVYRVVDNEGLVRYGTNLYSVPWDLIGSTICVKITEQELIAFNEGFEECVRHPLFPRHESGKVHRLPEHDPRESDKKALEVLRQRFERFGKTGAAFFEGLKKTSRFFRKAASRVLAFLETYSAEDLKNAMSRAVRYGAYRPDAIERILAREAKPFEPQSIQDPNIESRVQDLLRGDPPVKPRDLNEYQDLLTDENQERKDNHGTQDKEQG